MSNFLQSAAMTFVDSLEAEINSATEGMRELIEHQSLWGAATDLFTGDTYQYSGIYPWILNDAPTTNVIDIDGTVTLSLLDNALDATMFKYQNLRGGKWLFVASPGMISKIGSLQTLIRRNVQQVEFEGGFTMDSYRGVPILPSGFVAPSSTAVSVTGLGATGAGSGSVPNGNYRYKVAAITLYGEQVASATAVGAMSSNATCSLSWTANANAKSYAIYRSDVGDADDDDNYDLLDIIAAKSYNAAGTVTGNVTTYSDAFTLTRKALVHPLGASEECIFLVYFDQLYGASLAVLPPAMGDQLGGDPLANLVRYVTLNETTDSFQFRLNSFHTLSMPDASTCAVIRRAKTS